MDRDRLRLRLLAEAGFFALLLAAVVIGVAARYGSLMLAGWLNQLADLVGLVIGGAVGLFTLVLIGMIFIRGMRRM